MNTSSKIGIVLAFLIVGNVIVGCSKETDPPKIEMSTEQNSQGHKPVGIKAGGSGGATTPSTQ